jgi:hypothetical protein
MFKESGCGLTLSNQFHGWPFDGIGVGINGLCECCWGIQLWSGDFAVCLEVIALTCIIAPVAFPVSL